MTGLTMTNWRARLFLTGTAAALAALMLTAGSKPAEAWFGFGVPCCGFGIPGPYFGYYPPPAPYYYPPPMAYAPGYYPPAAYPQPTAPAASAYTAAPAAPAAGGATTSSAAAEPAKPAITYTKKPAFTNAAGQTCREYKATDANSGHDVLGTACRQPDGQWRVTN